MAVLWVKCGNGVKSFVLHSASSDAYPVTITSKSYQYKSGFAAGNTDAYIDGIEYESGYGDAMAYAEWDNSGTTNTWDIIADKYVATRSTEARYVEVYATLVGLVYYGRLRLYANGGNFYGTTSDYIDWPTSGAVSGTGTSGALVSITLPVSTGNFVPYRAGYTFVGWATSSAATSATYISGEDVSFTAKSTSSSSPTTVSLYAVWKQTFTLTYATSYNGVTNMPDNVTGITSGTGVTVSPKVPVLNGYTFKGWSKTNGGTVQYVAGNNIYITADVTLWTVFERNIITSFYWDGADGTNDISLIAKGKEVKTAITATRWNNLLAKIKELADACGVSFSYIPMSSGDGITAARFNAAREGLENIKAALGTTTVLPAVAVSRHDVADLSEAVVYATMFVGNGSIKGALNALIGAYNG